MVLEWGSLGLTITNDFCKSSFCTHVHELAALERTDVHVHLYCNRSIYLILPGRDGWSLPSGHMHASTFTAATRLGGLAGSQPRAGGKLRNDHPVHVTVTVCMIFSLCPSDIFMSSCFTPSKSNILFFYPSLCILDYCAL